MNFLPSEIFARLALPTSKTISEVEQAYFLYPHARPASIWSSPISFPFTRTTQSCRPYRSRFGQSARRHGRRDHDLLTDAALGRDQRQESRRGGSRRTGHGVEVRSIARSPRSCLHDLTKQEGRRAPPGCRRSRRLSQCRRDAEARRQLRLYPRRGLRGTRYKRYINLLRRDGNITLVGAPEKPLAVAAFGLLFRRRSLSGSPIGGIPETQEMLDFCGDT